MIKRIEKVGLNGKVYTIFDPVSLKEHQDSYVAEIMARTRSKPATVGSYSSYDPGAYAGEGYYSHDPDCVSGL